MADSPSVPPKHPESDLMGYDDEQYRKWQRANEAPTVYSHEDPHDGKRQRRTAMSSRTRNAFLYALTVLLSIAILLYR